MEGGAHSLSSQNLIPQPHLMNSIFPSSTTRLLSNPSKIRVLSKLFSIESCRKRDSVSVKVRDAELKENWLASLSCSEELRNVNGSGLKWMIGVDPDLSGALALLKFQGDSVCSAQVFDTPYLQVLVGKGVRRRHDAKSISQLLRSFDAPFGMWTLSNLLNKVSDLISLN
ncbi:hypothetical protein GIB67_000601 [Kingdonia uniflora]|uniref:Uncharacterized protein n=1 Tax=Kingdonia uniflora TaxID=39325 RepID=A0A7J7P7E6_9MAGN|nr:hypothetical protein GIB67_000601 [Kingdonia uniflora]